MSARFYLHRRSDSGREKRLRLIVSRGGRKIAVTTPVVVKASDWSQSMQRLKSTAVGATDLNAELDRLRNDANALALAHPDDDDLQNALLERLGRAPKEPDPTLLEHFDVFLDHKRQRVKASTMQVYEALKEHLESFLDGAPLVAADVGRGFVEDFQTHLVGTKLANRTSNKYASRLRTFLRWLEERGHIERVPKAKPLKTADSHVIRLTLDELDALQRVDLSNDPKGYRSARDIFLMCVYTGQRIGDVTAIEWKDVQGDAWYLREEKTGVIRRVPLPAPALEIIDRHEGKRRPIPKLSEQRCNDYIKEVAKRAKINAPVTLRTQKGGKVEAQTIPKHEAISTHVGRKTYVSLMMEAGLSPKEMLGVTHKDLRSLEKYAGASDVRLRKAVTGVFGSSQSN